MCSKPNGKPGKFEDREPRDDELEAIASEEAEYDDIDSVGDLTDSGMDDAVRQYLYEIGCVAVLPASEQIKKAEERCAMIETIEMLQEEIKGEKKKEKPDVEKIKLDRELIGTLKESAELIKNELIETNLRLVVSIAKHYVNKDRGMTFLDIIQEGNLGLQKGVQKFDPKRGFNLSTCATWWIKQAIRRAIKDHGLLIRLPVHTSDKLDRINRVKRQIEANGDEATPEAIASRIPRMSAGTVAKTLLYETQIVSLYEPVGSDESTMLVDMIPDTRRDNPADQIMNDMLRYELQKVMKELLSPRDRFVIELRFGLYDGKEYTLEDVAAQLIKHPELYDDSSDIKLLTRERIRQIEAKALKKLREPRKVSRQLRDYLED